MKKFKHVISVTALVLITTVALFYVFDFMFQTPTVASEEAVLIDGFIDLHLWMMSFLFSLIMVIVLYSAFIFRLKDDEDPEETYGSHVEGNTVLEIAWTIVPTIVVIIFGVYAITVLGEILAPEPDEMTVHVTGRQWSWSFNYPDLENRGNVDLVLPVNQPVLLEMESEDVLHNFWVPEFRVKQDLVPGSVEVLRFTPTEVGEFTLRCAEICGLQHAVMLANVNVVSEADWDTFQQEVLDRPLFSELTPEERGEIWWSAAGFGCDSCHTIDGTEVNAPTWLDLYGSEETLADGTTVIVDDEFIIESILNPDATIIEGYADNLMPEDYEERIAQAEADILNNEGIEINILEDLIAFMKTLHEDVNAN